MPVIQTPIIILKDTDGLLRAVRKRQSQTTLKVKHWPEKSMPKKNILP